MTKLNEKSRILLGIIIVSFLGGAFLYAQGADLTLDAVDGVYNALWLNGTNGALQTGLYVDLVDEFSLASGVTVDGVLLKDNTVVALTVNTGQGANELFSMNQDVETTDAVTFLTIDTGQGANELYDMDQNVLQASTPTFAGGTFTGTVDLNQFNQALDIHRLQDSNTWISFTESATEYWRLGFDSTGNTERFYLYDVVAGGNVFVINSNSQTMDFQSNPVNNLGAAGNDFGASNNLVTSTFSGNIDLGLQDMTGIDTLTRASRMTIDFLANDIMVQNAGGVVDVMDFSIGVSPPTLAWSSGLTQTGVILSGNMVPSSNNTQSVGTEPIRFADGYFVTVTAKNTVTGKIIENEITANPLESFEEGDLVQVLDTSYFTKTKNKLANVIGVVTLNPGNIQTGTETVTSWVDEIQDVTRSVSWLENVTDAYGQVYEIERTGEEPVYEWYLKTMEETLSDGNTVLYYENRTRIKTETVQVEVTTEIPIMGPKNEPVLCVFGGPTLVKISEPVLFNDVLVASAVDGKARPLRTVLPEIIEQYGGLEMNWDNVLTAIEKLNYKTLGRVMEDSEGDYCWAMIGY